MGRSTLSMCLRRSALTVAGIVQCLAVLVSIVMAHPSAATRVEGGTLSVSVKASDTGAMISGAGITVADARSDDNPTRRTGVTDASGYYRFTGLPTGTGAIGYRIFVVASGYNQTVSSCAVYKGDTARRDFVLRSGAGAVGSAGAPPGALPELLPVLRTSRSASKRIEIAATPAGGGTLHTITITNKTLLWWHFAKVLGGDAGLLSALEKARYVLAPGETLTFTGVPLRSPDSVQFTMRRDGETYMMNLAQVPILSVTGNPVRRENWGALTQAAASAGVEMSLDWAERNQADLAGKIAQLQAKYTGKPTQSKLVVTQMPTVQRFFGLLGLLDVATSAGPAGARFIEEWTGSPSEITLEVRR